MQVICKTFPINTLTQYKYVVVLSEYGGRIMLSRHKQRTTWETQGGHIEPGETPLEAAKRELYEESGAAAYDMIPLCDYWAGVEGTDQGANGMVFSASIHALAALPESEMAEVALFDVLPEQLTYPEITPTLFAYRQGECPAPISALLGRRSSTVPAPRLSHFEPIRRLKCCRSVSCWAGVYLAVGADSISGRASALHPYPPC